MILRSEQEITASWRDDTSVSLVSICCTTYNQKRYIASALDGFLIQQTYFPIEVLVYDDASTDGTSEVVREYHEKYPNIIKPIIQTENQFSQGKRPGWFNYERAVGKYVAICEGDDYWTDPNKLKLQVNFLEQNPEYVITYHSCEPFDENGIIPIHFGGAEKDLSAWELQQASSIYTLTTCFRNYLKDLPPEYHIARYADLFIWSFLGAYGKGKFMGNIQPARYRVHSGGMHSMAGRKKNYEMRLSTMAALFTYYERVGEYNLSKYFKKDLLSSTLKSFEVIEIVKLAFGWMTRKLNSFLFYK